MIKPFIHRKARAYFSQWNRKGYAVFAGLGREILISVLALHMCKYVLLKSSAKGVIVNEDKSCKDFFRNLSITGSLTVTTLVILLMGKVYPFLNSYMKMKEGYMVNTICPLFILR